MISIVEVKPSRVRVVEGKINAVGNVSVSSGILRVPVKVGDKWVDFRASNIKELKNKLREINIGDNVRIECLTFREGKYNRLLAIGVSKTDNEGRGECGSCSEIIKAIWEQNREIMAHLNLIEKLIKEKNNRDSSATREEK